MDRIANREIDMSEQQPDALRQAAATLLAGAPAGAVLLAMRALLDGWDASSGVPPEAAARPPQAAWRADDKAVAPKPATPSRATAAPSKAAERAAWDHLRLAVREARAARGVTTEALAKELGLAHATVATALRTRTLPTKRLRQRLTDWLAAPEVAVPIPFRRDRAGPTAGNGIGAGNGTSNGPDNGADHATG
jgi:hypothetical protein